MPLALGLAIIAVISFGANDLLIKRAVQGGALPHQLVMIMGTVGAVLSLSFSVLLGRFQPTVPALWGSVAGVLGYFSFVLFSQSMKQGAASVAAPVFRLNFVITAILAVLFLSEAITTPKLVGFALAIVAIWLLLVQPNVKTVTIPRAALIPLLAGTFLGGVGFFFSKLGTMLAATAATVLTFQVAAVAVSGVAITVAREGGLHVSRESLISGVKIGFIQTIGLGCLIESFSLGEVTILSPIGQLSFVVTAILGILILKEALTARKVLGLASAVGAVAVLGYAAHTG